MKNKTTVQKAFIYIPFFLVLTLIPLLTFAHKYTNRLDTYAWYSTNDVNYDFFLYWKAIFLMITGILALCLFLYFICKNKTYNPFAKHTFFFVPLFIYLVFALISACLAMEKIFSFFGGAEQFEGFFVLLTYVVMTCYAVYFVQAEKDIEVIYHFLMVGTGLLAAIGAFQFLGLDFYQSKLGQGLITLLEPTLWGKSLKFNFESGRSYASLYNPNYIGSYVALLLPVVVFGAGVLKKLWEKTIMGVIAVFLLLSLIGSESMTGYLALFLTLILFAIILIPKMKNHKKQAIFLAAGLLLACCALVIVKHDVVKYGINKMVNFQRNDYSVKKIVNSDKGLEVTTDNGAFYIQFESSGKQVNFALKDAEGKKLEARTSGKSSDIIVDKRFYGFVITVNEYSVGNKQLVGFTLGKDGRAWNFIPANNKYYYYNVFNRVDRIVDVKGIGFENTQHFGSRRGYIWSRTLPLLGNSFFWGCGPDNFILTFPNNDYVGLANNNYTGQIVTKPHNMYLQMAVQTGVISLIAFLVFYIIYFVRSVKLYYRVKAYGMWEKTGMGILLGTFGYMITGLANDSTVTVAPIFWTLLGIGVAVNEKIIKAVDK